MVQEILQPFRWWPFDRRAIGGHGLHYFQPEGSESLCASPGVHRAFGELSGRRGGLLADPLSQRRLVFLHEDAQLVVSYLLLLLVLSISCI